MAYKSGSATNYINLLDKLVAFCLAKEAASAVVAVGGANYAPGDTLTLVGGTPETVATFTVSTVDPVTGEVWTVTPFTAGLYCNGSEPGNPVATTVSPAGGDNNCTLTVTWSGALGWTEDRNVVYSGSDKEVILHGDGGGPFAIYVGIRSFNDAAGSGAYNWELAGFTGYTPASTWAAQPGISPGRYSVPDYGAYVPLRNAAITYWFFVTNRRIICVFKVGTMYSNMYLGFINPFGTDTEYPYPLAVFGCTSLWNRLYSYNTIAISGLTDPIATVNVLQGVALIRDTAGVWRPILNSKDNAGSRTADVTVAKIFPAGQINLPDFAVENRPSATWAATGYIPNTGVPGTPSYRFVQTEAGAADLTVLFPTIIQSTNPNFVVFGELDNVFWLSAYVSPASIVSEDTVTIGGDVYLCFQNGQRTAAFSYFAIKQE